MKTVNLELAKQLKEAGYPQGIEFYYGLSENYMENGEPKSYVKDEHYELIYGDDSTKYYAELICASPTVDEILDQINEPNMAITFKFMRTSGNWFLDAGLQAGIPHAKGESMADAAARMWLYLKKENLL